MKQSNIFLNPCYFDDKDIIVDGTLWEWFFDQGKYIPWCISDNNYEALFFIGNNPYHAVLGKRETLTITPARISTLSPLIISESDAEDIIESLTQWNNEKGTDIYCKVFYTKSVHISRADEITSIIIHYYHTTG